MEKTCAWCGCEVGFRVFQVSIGESFPVFCTSTHMNLWFTKEKLKERDGYPKEWSK